LKEGRNEKGERREKERVPEAEIGEAGEVDKCNGWIGTFDYLEIDLPPERCTTFRVRVLQFCVLQSARPPVKGDDTPANCEVKTCLKDCVNV